VKQIASALVKAQKAFGPALKTNTNPAFRSKYADLSACIEAVIDALNDNGIFLLQRNSESVDGVTVETVFVHESGETLDCGKLYVPAVKHDAQGHGSALTYARRYSLMAACGIAPEDDDGNAAKGKPDAARQTDPKALAPTDNSAKARAHRIAQGVANGDAAGAAEAMTQWPQDEIDAVWALLPAAVTRALTAAWPKVAA